MSNCMCESFCEREIVTEHWLSCPRKTENWVCRIEKSSFQSVWRYSTSSVIYEQLNAGGWYSWGMWELLWGLRWRYDKLMAPRPTAFSYTRKMQSCAEIRQPKRPDGSSGEGFDTPNLSYWGIHRVRGKNISSMGRLFGRYLHDMWGKECVAKILYLKSQFSYLMLFSLTDLPVQTHFCSQTTFKHRETCFKF